MYWFSRIGLGATTRRVATIASSIVLLFIGVSLIIRSQSNQTIAASSDANIVQVIVNASQEMSVSDGHGRELWW